MITLINENKQEKRGNIELYYLVKYFLDEEKEIYKKNTFEGRKLITNKYIVPYFNSGITLQDCFSISNVDKFHHEIYELNLSISRKNLIYATFKNLLNYAEEREFLPYEYSEKIKRIVKFIRKNKIVKKPVDVWTPNEFDRFIKTFSKKDKQYKMLFLITYWGALRMGEVLALTLDDIDFVQKKVSINKAIDRDGVISAPKNESSNNSVDLPTFLIKELEEYVVSEGIVNCACRLFFKTGVISRTHLRTMMNKHIKMANLKHIKFHGLRHSMASRMINEGLNPLIVSKHLRHSSTQQTLDTYSHLFPNITKGIIDKLV